jgi:hypothetical protein
MSQFYGGGNSNLKNPPNEREALTYRFSGKKAKPSRPSPNRPKLDTIVLKEEEVALASTEHQPISQPKALSTQNNNPSIN